MEIIIVSAEEYDELMRLLDEPPKHLPKLAELMRRPTLFQEDPNDNDA